MSDPTPNPPEPSEPPPVADPVELVFTTTGGEVLGSVKVLPGSLSQYSVVSPKMADVDEHGRVVVQVIVGQAF